MFSLLAWATLLLGLLTPPAVLASSAPPWSGTPEQLPPDFRLWWELRDEPCRPGPRRRVRAGLSALRIVRRNEAGAPIGPGIPLQITCRPGLHEELHELRPAAPLEPGRFALQQRARAPGPLRSRRWTQVAPFVVSSDQADPPRIELEGLGPGTSPTRHRAPCPEPTHQCGQLELRYPASVSLVRVAPSLERLEEAIWLPPLGEFIWDVGEGPAPWMRVIVIPPLQPLLFDVHPEFLRSGFVIVPVGRDGTEGEALQIPPLQTLLP